MNTAAFAKGLRDAGNALKRAGGVEVCVLLSLLVTLPFLIDGSRAHNMFSLSL